jgi:hypothetical protein
VSLNREFARSFITLARAASVRAASGTRAADATGRIREAGGRITYRFHARDLHLVMKPSAAGKSVRFRILLDGQPPGAAHGADVDEQGNGTATEPRLYQLIRQPGAIGDRHFEIEFLDSDIRGY